MTALDEALATIAADREHGAAELARRCLALVAGEAREAPARDVERLRARLLAQASRLAQCRPSMAPIANLLQRWREQVAAAPARDVGGLRRHAVAVATALIEASLNAGQDAARHAAVHLHGCRVLMTHSYSGTVLDALRQMTPPPHVIFTESRPLQEGHRLGAQLQALGLAATLITDAQMGLAVSEADAVLIGADTLLSDGAVVNKAGSYLLALAARAADRPMYVCCESFKRRAADAPSPALERMAPAELGAPSWSGIEVRNVYFDLTPAALISAWISERGVSTRGSDA